MAARFTGNKTAEVALSEHESDPDTWQAPLAKALAVTGASADESVIVAAQKLMALLDAAGTRAGKYEVDLRGGQGVQVGEGNQQFNVYNAAPGIVMAPQGPRVRPGQPGNEAAFEPVYEAAGGAEVLGAALGEVVEDGPGLVQRFGGGPAGQPAVICALYRHVPVAMAQEVWNELCAIGRGPAGGTADAGFPVAGQRPFIGPDAGTIELEGGKWGRGRLVRAGEGRWRWQPHVVFDSQAFQDQDTWSARREEMDLRLRLAARIPLAADDLRISEKRRTRVLAALSATGLIGLVTALAQRYGLQPQDLDWQETPEPTGYNDTLRAAYQAAVAGPDERTALLAALWFTLPQGYTAEARSIVDLSVDFDAFRPETGRKRQLLRAFP